MAAEGKPTRERGEDEMTLVRESAMRVLDLPVERVRANGWNVNRVPEAVFAKLREYVRREGLLEPLVVRPTSDGMFELIGGEHRWRVARELGWATVPCAIVELDDRRARIASINLNSLKGDNVPALLAELLHDLSKELTVEDLASQLPWDTTEIDDYMQLLKIPDGLEAQLEAEAERMERERVRVLSFAVSAEQEAVIEEALTRAAGVAGSSRAASLVHVARKFLEAAG